MLKNILKLNGAQELSENEQKKVNGGLPMACSQIFANGCDRQISQTTCNQGGGSYLKLCKCCQ